MDARAGLPDDPASMSALWVHSFPSQEKGEEEMNDQDQIIALAKWAGELTTCECACGEDCGKRLVQAPSYTTDLNAVHRVTMKLDDQQLCRMAEWLCKITGFHTRIFHATARQRCEALLRTLGLWKEDA